MRVLLINQTFYPDHAATAQHAYDLARDLVAHGHQVQVIASRSSYGSRGSVLPKHETVDGIDIHRVGKSLFGKASILLRLIDFGLFYLAATIKALRMPRPEVVIPLTTPPMIVLIGYLLSRVKRCAYVYWLMDIYPDVPVASGMLHERRGVVRVLESLHCFAMRRADRVIVLGRCMQDRVIAKGVPSERVTLIRPWADVTEIHPMQPQNNPLRQAWAPKDALTVMYSGNFGLAHNIDTITHAMILLRDEPTIQFVFVGGGKGLDQVRQVVEHEGLSHVRFEPYQPREKLSQSLGAGDVHLISQAQAMTGLVVPSKVFGIMAAARPAIFVGSHEAEVAKLLREADGGPCVEPGDTNALVQAIQWMARHPDQRQAMGERLRQAMVLTYDRALATAAWQDVLKACVRESKETSGPPVSGDTRG